MDLYPKEYYQEQQDLLEKHIRYSVGTPVAQTRATTSFSLTKPKEDVYYNLRKHVDPALHKEMYPNEA